MTTLSLSLCSCWDMHVDQLIVHLTLGWLSSDFHLPTPSIVLHAKVPLLLQKTKINSKKKRNEKAVPAEAGWRQNPIDLRRERELNLETAQPVVPERVTPDLETTREFEKHGRRRRPHGPRNSLSDYFFRGILKNNA